MLGPPSIPELSRCFMFDLYSYTALSERSIESPGFQCVLGEFIAGHGLDKDGCSPRPTLSVELG